MSNRLAEIEQRQAAYKAYFPSDSDLWPTALRQALSDVDWLVAERHKADWISVKERLPEDGSTALVFAHAGTMLICAYVNGRWYEDIDEADIEGVTHWMLPEPPKE